MEHESFLVTLIFISAFLVLTALLKSFCEQSKLPYTVMLIVLGFVVKYFLLISGIDLHLELSTDLIYFLILPFLLFESAVQVNAHQFRLQFKTITFMATVGLLFSVFGVGFGLSMLLGFPFEVALLFGALISSTDPIAVLSLFKSLGAPKRLSLLAEGESMFNDATGVIAFRVIAGIVLAGTGTQSFNIFSTISSFLFVFIGSLVVGTVLGYITAQFIALVENDRLVETTLTVALALGSFVVAEHIFHFSGVITTVAAGITMGNVGRTKISGSVITFMHEFWEYVGFLGVSAVFFFTALGIDVVRLVTDWQTTAVVILVVLLARAISVYGSFLITNNNRFFANEPNVPLSWQHVMNWGGLRGVIPLVLVYSLPEDFYLKEEFLRFTLSTFLFTLFFNATTITWLLKQLRLHIPKKEEELIKQELDIFSLESARESLLHLSLEEFDHRVIKEVDARLSQEEQQIQSELLRSVSPNQFELSLRLQAIRIERDTIQKLFFDGHINENVLFDFDAELDLQQDALEYPEVSKGRSFSDGGYMQSSQLFKGRMKYLREYIQRFPFLKPWVLSTKERLVLQRFSLLQARIVASGEVIRYLGQLKKFIPTSSRMMKVIEEVLSEHEQYRLKNAFQMQTLEREYQRWYKKFETMLIESFAWSVRQSNSRTH